MPGEDPGLALAYAVHRGVYVYEVAVALTSPLRMTGRNAPEPTDRQACRPAFVLARPR